VHHLREVESQLTLAQSKIANLTKELAQKAKEMTKAKQATYDLG